MSGERIAAAGERQGPSHSRSARSARPGAFLEGRRRSLRSERGTVCSEFTTHPVHFGCKSFPAYVLRLETHPMWQVAARLARVLLEKNSKRVRP